MIYIKILEMHLVIIIFMLAYIFELHLFHFVMRELHCDPDALCLAQTISFKNQQKIIKKTVHKVVLVVTITKGLTRYRKNV